MHGFSAAVRFTLLRSMREPALVIVVGASILLLLVVPAGTALGFHEEESLMRDVGLSTILLSGILIALVAGGVHAGGIAATELLALRPSDRGVVFAGTAAGALLALLIGNGVVLFCGSVILRHRTLAFADAPAFVMAGGVVLLSILWGAYRNARTGRSFVTGAVAGALILSVLAALLAAVWAPEGRLRTTLPPEDVILLQTELLCLFMSLAVFAAVWTGSTLCGRVGGVVTGWSVVIAGVVRENLLGLPSFLEMPLAVLVPNLSLAWGGDLFYADVATLPWAFVGSAVLYLSLWSAGALLLGMGVSLCRGSRGLRGAELRAG